MIILFVNYFSNNFKFKEGYSHISGNYKSVIGTYIFPGHILHYVKKYKNIFIFIQNNFFV